MLNETTEYSMKRSALVLFVLMLALFILSSCSALPNKSQTNFHLRLYEEAESYTANGGTQEKIVTALTSPSGIFDKNESGKYTYLKYAFFLPGAINAEQAPEYITYRSRQDNVTISLPIELRYENASKELTLPWEEASIYPQTWFILELNAEQLSNLQPNPDRPTEMEYCINQLEDSFLEIEATYRNGASAKKLYSINPGEKGTFELDYVLMTEEESASG